MPAKKRKMSGSPRISRLDTARLYNTDEFSDITINFSGRKVKAHRFVLCGQAPYFRKLCHPDSGFAEAKATEITLHDDDPDALETVLRYLYGLDPVDLTTSEMAAAVIRSVQVIITADKYGIDRQLITSNTRSLSDSVSELEDPQTILSVLKMCTVDSEIHPLLVSTVENILRIRMTELAEVPEWFDWIHSVPAVNKKISKEAAQIMELKNDDTVLCCEGCGTFVFTDPLTGTLECSCGPNGENWYDHTVSTA